MNTYKKYCPHVYLAKTSEVYKKGDVIILTTRHGKENRHIVYNLIYTENGFNYYSIIREDGFNSQKRALKKAEQRKEWADSAERKATEYYEASREGEEFLKLGEPIKIGHHSENRHRNLIERNHRRFGRYVEETKKAEKHIESAENFKLKATEINLSMPESIEYFEFELEKAKAVHEGMKNGNIQRGHSYSLTYAKKRVNEMEDKYKLAVKLWGE